MEYAHLFVHATKIANMTLAIYLVLVVMTAKVLVYVSLTQSADKYSDDTNQAGNGARSHVSPHCL